jgi:hypothetical protein
MMSEASEYNLEGLKKAIEKGEIIVNSQLIITFIEAMIHPTTISDSEEIVSMMKSYTLSIYEYDILSF